MRKIDEKNKARIFSISFASIYPLYIQKAEKKGRTKEELNKVIFWLTGYNKKHCNNKLTRNVV